MPNTVRVDTLRRAAQALGGVAGLARALGFSPRQIERWLNGEEAVPTDAFLHAVDLIEDSQSGAEKAPPKGSDPQHG